MASRHEKEGDTSKPRKTGGVAGLPGLASPWCGVPCFCRAYSLAGPGEACRLRIPDLWEGLPGKSQLGNAAALVWGPIRPRGVDALSSRRRGIAFRSRRKIKAFLAIPNSSITKESPHLQTYPCFDWDLQGKLPSCGRLGRCGCTAILILETKVSMSRSAASLAPFGLLRGTR